MHLPTHLPLLMHALVLLLPALVLLLQVCPAYQSHSLRCLSSPVQGDDSLFKAKFCVAYQSMSTIGFQFPADYAAIAPQFVLS